MAIEILACDTPELQSALFEFRYRIWAGELGAEVPEPAAARMSDGTDQRAINYAALDKGQIVGSLRVTDLRLLADASAMVSQYHLQDLVDAVGTGAMSHVGRLAVDRGNRGGACLLRLMEHALVESVKRDIRAFFFDCSPYLLRMYETLGAVRTGAAFNDAMLGFKLPMAMVTRDIAYLEEIGSPFLRMLKDLPPDPVGPTWRQGRGVSGPTRSLAEPETLLANFEQRLDRKSVV